MDSNGSATPRKTPGKKRHLVLNMDVNKTVIMVDTVTGKTAEDVVNETIANACWGEEVNGLWVLRHRELSVCRPATELDGCSELISYAEWVNKTYPGSSNKKKRGSLNGAFTHRGQPGEELAAHAAKSLAALKKPNGEDVRILPGFFELLLWLKRERRSFSLCFRTFGEDLPEIATELNAFCEGQHPLFPSARMDGSDGEPDYRFRSDNADRSGTFHRDNETTTLIMGTYDQAGEGPYKDVKDRTMNFYRNRKDIKIFSGYEAVRAKLEVLTQKCGTVGLRDYFAYWKDKKQTSDGGKMFFYNPSRWTNQHELFFDDNIHFSDCYIVQPIDVLAPDRHHWAVPLLHTHLCRAEPLESIPDRFWFVKQVQRLEAGYERKLRAREQLLKLMRRVVRMKRMGGKVPEVPGESRLSEFDAWRDLRRDDHELSLHTLDEGEAC